MLGLSIGASTAIFSVVNAVILQPLPYENAHRLVLLSTSSTQDSLTTTTYEDFLTLRQQSRTLENMAVYYGNSGWSRVTLAGGGEPEIFQAGFVSANLFPLLGVSPSLGRVFTVEEETAHDRVAVLSDSLWKSRFGASPAVLGGTIELDGAMFRVIGVMPPVFQFPARETQLWAPITTNKYWPEHAVLDGVHSRGFYMRWNVIARLKPGVDVRTAQAEATGIASRLERERPDLNRGIGIHVVPLSVHLSGTLRLALFVLAGAVICVLLAGCGNVAGLILARGASRRHEMAVRTALGASRARLVRQLLVESLVLSLLAGCLGVFLARPGVRALVHFGPGEVPRLEQAAIDGRALLFAIAVSVFAAIACGLAPAWRISQNEPKSSLSRNRSRGVLITLEFALSTILLIGAGLLTRSFLAIRAVDPGFRADHVLTLRISPPDRTDVLLERIREIPGVAFVGGIDGLFELGAPSLFEQGAKAPARGLSLRAVEGREIGSPMQGAGIVWTTTGGEALQAMGVKLLAGRFFSERDGPGSPLAAVIDEALARRYWPGEDPVGKRFKGQDRRGKNDEWVTVIGVVCDMRRAGLENQSVPHVFEWERQSGETTPDIVIRTAVEPLQLAGVVRKAAREVNRNVVIERVDTLEQRLNEQLAPRRFETWLLGLFSFLAWLLAGAGIYAAMHYSVAQRTREIGIRMALGARMSTVVFLVLRQGLSVALVGVGIGAIAALWVARLLSSLLYGVTRTDPLTFAAVLIFLAMTGIAAAAIPAWRAAKIDPAIALRQE